ncbi:MAG: HD domain-containing phosphohydrolase [Gallionella sp.]
MTTSWLQSLRVQIGFALLAIFLVLAGTLTYTLFKLNLRQHDYLILNLTGQMRVISQTMVEQARYYRVQAAESYASGNHGLEIYAQDLQKQTTLFNQIVISLEDRQIAADLTPDPEHGKIICTWDDQSRLQMSKTAADWKQFKTGLDSQLGGHSEQSRLILAAKYIEERGNVLVQSSERLAQAFQYMMQAKLDEIRLFQWLAAGMGIILLGVVVYMIQRLVIRPLNITLEGFSQVANGNFKHRLPVLARNEIGQMTWAFNRLTERLNSMFRLTDRINQGKKLDEMLAFVYEELHSFVPLDWVGVFYASPDGSNLSLERHFSQRSMGLKEGDCFDIHLGGLAAISQTPLALSLSTADIAPNSLDEVLLNNGLNAAVYLLLPTQGSNRAVMVFASEVQAYEREHVEFLTNIAGTISHVLEKTVVMESLVASAVQGLAKLAESRDPETGDHLTRMALYSALVAEELARAGSYVHCITPAYVRDVYHFAPMHDIGKVGVPDGILLKPGKLNNEERKEMERHPTIGAEVLRRCEAQLKAQGHSMFQIGIEIAESHHEKFDGSGYPVGLKGQDIPLSARIVAVADVFDALTSKRPYKEAWTIEKAISVMQENSGTHFDPEVFAAMLRTLPRMMTIYNRLKHI